jgi:hypothetical protein
MLMLIDTRRPPPPDPGRAAWEPNWRLWAWVALAVVAAVGAHVAGGFPGYVLVCAAIGFACRAILVAFPYGGGLTEYRQ